MRLGLYKSPIRGRNSRFKSAAIIFGKRGQRGFTAVELVVVIALVALLLALAVPSFTEWRNNTNLKAAARDVVSSFQFARVEAARRDATVTIRVTTGGGGTGNCTVFVDNGQGGGTADDGVRNGSEPLLREITVPKGVTLISTTRTSYRFTNRGFPVLVTGDVWPATIAVGNGKRTYTVTLAAAGAVQLSGPT